MKGTANLLPIPIVIWRCLWLIPYFITLALHMTVTLIGFGPTGARNLWEDRFKF